MLGLLLLLIGTIAAFRPAFAQCTGLTNEQVETEIYAKIMADKGLAAQEKHINVIASVTLSAVKFYGWTDNQSDYDKVYSFGSSYKCFKINVNDFRSSPPPEGDRLRGLPGGCAAGYKVCGDLCIPEGDTCNIGKTRAASVSIFAPDMITPGLDLFGREPRSAACY